ncbi:MAG: metal ABC transporter substrate-binding protein [Ruminococcus sp.]
MKLKYKLLCVALVICMVFPLFVGCQKQFENNGKIKVVATVFPQYDWAREIAKGSPNIDLSLLLDKGVDMHSFQPTVDDLVKIKEADVLLYIGGESDDWIKEAIADKTNENMIEVNLLEALGNDAKIEEAVNGEEHNHIEEEESEVHNHSGEEYDEHIWMSIKNAEKLSDVICDSLSKADSANKRLYESNAESFVKKLRSYDNKYQRLVENSKNHTLVFADRFPFRYLFDDYNLEYYSAFNGCAAETEASFATMTRLINNINDENLSSVMVTESSDKKMAKTIAANTKTKDQKIYTLDSMQSVNSLDIEKGTTYLSIIKSNLKVLEKALNQ